MNDPIYYPFNRRGCVRNIEDPADLDEALRLGYMWSTAMPVSARLYAIDQIVSGAVIETDRIRSHFPAGLAEHIAALRNARA